MLSIKSTPYRLINRQLYNMGIDEVLWICALECEREALIIESHNGGASGHYQGETATWKIMQEVIWWPTLLFDRQQYVQKCDICQRIGHLLRKHQIYFHAVTPSLPFKIWSINFVSSFPKIGKRTREIYIVTTGKYLTKWENVELAGSCSKEIREKIVYENIVT